MALRRELSARLPEAILPKVYRHVTEFPLNANRKVDRRRGWPPPRPAATERRTPARRSYRDRLRSYRDQPIG
ncbi:hypothetical protein ACH4TS_23580 [Streptomyces albidoflavus]